MTLIDFNAASAIFAIVALGSILLFAELLGRPLPRVIFLTFICLTALVCSWSLQYIESSALSGMLYADSFTYCFNLLIIGGVFCTALLNEDLLEHHGVRLSADIDVLVLFAAAGAMVMVAAANLIVFFLGFELMSVCVYVLTASARREKASSEGGLKYFVLGAFSSAFLLYGIVLVYAATGTMEIAELTHKLSGQNTLGLFGAALIIFGFAFKTSLVPFHFWTPDAYQGAPPSITGFMAVVVKAAAFGAFLRLVLAGLGGVPQWQTLIWVLSALTMTWGNLAALRQRSVKRLLAYSSISHAGYVLMGLLAAGITGGSAAIYYLAAYALMTLAAFGVLSVACAGSEYQYGRDDIKILSNLGWREPFLGAVMAVAVLSLAGVPPLAGFAAKLYVFNAAIERGFIWLSVIAALNALVGLYYYLRILVVMYFPEGLGQLSFEPVYLPTGARLALLVVTFGTFYVGIFSGPVLYLAQLAIQNLT